MTAINLRSISESWKNTASFFRTKPEYALLVVGFFLLYAPLALRASQGLIYEAYNYAFDLDVSRFAEGLGGVSDPDGVKHPYISLLRPLALPFQAVGFGWRGAAALTASAAGAATIAFALGFLRTIGLGRIDAVLLACFFGVSAAQMTNGFLPESYVFSSLGLTAAWLWAARRVKSGVVAHPLSPTPAVFLFGVTVTNILQAGLIEAAVRFSAHRVSRAFLFSMIRWGLIATIASLLLAALANLGPALNALDDPAGAVKKLLWAQTKGPTESLAQLLGVVFFMSVAAPAPTEVVLEDGKTILDYRTFVFSPLGWPALVVWIGLLAESARDWWKKRQEDIDWIRVGLVLALAFNIVFHLKYQFRGSIFLYVGHWSFALFALASYGGLSIAEWPDRLRAMVRAGAGLAVIGLGTANYLQSWRVASAFG
ncbi:MAG: hypothetical protein AAFR11_11405 [Pseudomonadota bacterium]